MRLGLVINLCMVKEWNVYLHKIKIYNVKWFDMSFMTDFNLHLPFERYSFNFWNTIPKPYNKVEGDLGESSGLIQFVFN